MKKITYTSVLLLVLLTTGCASVGKPPIVYDREFREIPEGLLQECVLPEMPLDNGELSEAFVVAYNCGELGNRDKQRIKALSTSNSDP